MKTPDSFVPLSAAPAPSAPREFRVAILNGHDHGKEENAAQKAGFQTLEAPRPSAFTAVGSAEKKIGEPRVTVQRDGDRITHLRIQCTCGMVMDLACVYDAPAAPTGEAKAP